MPKICSSKNFWHLGFLLANRLLQISSASICILTICSMFTLICIPEGSVQFHHFTGILDFSVAVNLDFSGSGSRIKLWLGFMNFCFAKYLQTQ